jgi:hypothetical protein
MSKFASVRPAVTLWWNLAWPPAQLAPAASPSKEAEAGRTIFGGFVPLREKRFAAVDRDNYTVGTGHLKVPNLESKRARLDVISNP